MTADIRTAAQAEAERRVAGKLNIADQIKVAGFIDGAVWGAALVTPAREQIAEAIARSMPGWNDETEDGPLTGHWEQVNAECLRQGRIYADAVLALMQEHATES